MLLKSINIYETTRIADTKFEEVNLPIDLGKIPQILITNAPLSPKIYI